MEKSRINGKNLFLSYQSSIEKNDLVAHLNKTLFKFGIKYMLIGRNILNLMVFICLENTINIRSGSVLNFNENEANYRVSNDISVDISQILQTNQKWMEGNCDHPIYLIHQIKEKEKEKETLRNEFIHKLQEKEKELALKENQFIHKLQEKEKEIEILKLKEEFINKSYERIKSQNENLMNSFLIIKENINENITENCFGNILNNISDASDFLATINDEFKKINDFSENDEIKKNDKFFGNNKNENKENYNDENNNRDYENQSK